jgi:hypothetical protein
VPRGDHRAGEPSSAGRAVSQATTVTVSVRLPPMTGEAYMRRVGGCPLPLARERGPHSGCRGVGIARLFHHTVNNSVIRHTIGAMAPRGMKPKPVGEARFRGRRVHDWIELEQTPFEGGPDLPPGRRDGRPWPDGMQQKWNTWRSMPHARLWGEADWQYAFDTAELAASAFQRDAKVGLLAELRLREKAMGTTWGARQDLRIRYIEPADESTPVRLTSLEEYRDL